MLLVSRFECKYWLPPPLVPMVRDFIRPYVRPDKYAAQHEGNRYPICSLYLDSPDLRLCRMTQEGVKNRFKLRVRSYTDNVRAPVFFEIKRRVNVILIKSRVAIDRARAWDLLSGRSRDLPVLAPEDRHKAEDFLQLALRTHAQPAAYIQYQREAYESVHDDPVRITFDTDLHYALAEGEDPHFFPATLTPAPMEGVILEIKFTERFPPWVERLVEVFELRQRSIPKYVLSIEAAIERGEIKAFVGDQP